MKQCPSCNEVFDDQKAFCDMDGSELIDQTDALREALNHANRDTGSSSPAWVTGAIGGFIGVIVCVLLYIGFLAPRGQDSQNQDRRTTQTRETQPAKSGQIAAAPQVNGQIPAVETATPTETETPSEAAPSPAEAAPKTTAVPPAALNSGPIATGGKSQGGGERAIIKMKDGSSVEADAAWEDAQGVWFRRSGLVSFVEKSRVEAIMEPPQRRPATPEVKTP